VKLSLILTFLDVFGADKLLLAGKIPKYDINFTLLCNMLQNLKQMYGAILISLLRLMDASHFEIFFLTTSSSHQTIEQLIRNSLCANNYSFIDEKINKLLIQMKSISFQDSVSQLSVVRLLHTCKCLVDEQTFPKDWFDLLILRDQ
jgi:hypothetical protein